MLLKLPHLVFQENPSSSSSLHTENGRSDTAKLVIFEKLCYGRSKGRNTNKREEE
jgi:hypothetical protein